MEIVFFIIFIIILYSKTQPDNRHADLFRLLIFGCVAFGFLSVFLKPLVILAIIGIIIYLIFNAQKNKESKEREKQYGWDPKRWDKEKGNSRTTSRPSQAKAQAQQPYTDTVKYDPLPKAIKKRKKIIRDFNEKYHLCLTDEQIQNITNSSYMSEIWNR